MRRCVHVFGFKGKGKGKGKGDCYNCGSPGHYSRECPCQPQGKGKSKGFQGECYNCGEKRHPSQKEKETVTKRKVKDGVGERAFGKSTEKNLKEIGNESRRRKSQGASIQLERRK